MIAEERRSILLRALNESGALSVAEACELLHVSRMTVHRDLETLSAAGLLRKVHGGAVPMVSRTVNGTARPFTERKPANASAKRTIARLLARILANARNLALDASSTVFALATSLPAPREKDGTFVVTNGIPLFLELQQRNAGFRVALTGGEMHPLTQTLVGPMAGASLKGLRFDFAVVSAAGWVEDTGEVYDSTPEGAAIKHAMLSRANKRVLAMDESKRGVLAPFPLGAVHDFDLLVTETGVRELKSTELSVRRNRL